LPGGTVEDGEEIKEALVRELIEETNIAPTIGELLYVHQFIHEDTEHLEFFFHIKNPEDFLSIDLSKTSHGGAEIEAIDFVDINKTVILPNFLKHESFDTINDSVEPVKFYFSK